MAVLQTLTTIAAFVVFLLLLIRYYFKKQYNFWKDRGVPFAEPSIPFGNLGSRLFYPTGAWMLHKPILFVNDLDLIKTILIKDFSHFHDRGAYHDPKGDPLSSHLVFLNGTEWRNMRAKLTPTFTSGKMKLMFPLIVECGGEMVKYLSTLANKKEEIEVKEIVARFTTDAIASCAFGVNANSIWNEKSKFREIGKELTELTFLQAIRTSLSFFAPSVAAFFKVRLTPKNVEQFLLNFVQETMDYRDKNGVKRNDFMQLLMQIMSKGRVEDVDAKKSSNEEIVGTTKRFTVTEATAQALVFYIGGFETTSAVINFALYELAKSPEVQKKLREEIDECLLKHGSLTYEAVNEMSYLNGVVNETLRMYPPGPGVVRECTAQYRVPGSDLTLERGTLIILPIMGIQNDERYFPQPKKFDPLRHTSEEVAKRNHFTFLPFGEGPRSCIGNRFGLLQSKLGLALLLSKYKFEVSPKTPIPVRFSASSMVTAALGGMHLRISHRDQ